ncbi:DUF1615 family protein, partial [Xanthomonas campestris]|uniref:DUF1615 family protein n=1 Tax=Xanthomonas campestris TaxID=339 RepID=UPI00403975CA
QSRFAVSNAAGCASRNPASRAALSRAGATARARDGALPTPGASRAAPGGTDRAARARATQLGMTARQTRAAPEDGTRADSGDTTLYRQVSAVPERAGHAALPRAVLPGITLESPKITRTLTTAWFAQRVNDRWKRCMAK